MQLYVIAQTSTLGISPCNPLEFDNNNLSERSSFMLPLDLTYIRNKIGLKWKFNILKAQGILKLYPDLIFLEWLGISLIFAAFIIAHECNNTLNAFYC